jgi:hypothetical protein
MDSTILDIINGGSIWLLLVDVDGSIAEQPVESRYLRDILEGEGLSDPQELVGRDVTLSEDGTAISLD